MIYTTSRSSLQPPRRRGRSSVRDLPSASGDCLITHLARFGHVGFGQEPHVLQQPLLPLFYNHHHLLKQTSIGTLRYQHCYRNTQLCESYKFSVSRPTSRHIQTLRLRYKSAIPTFAWLRLSGLHHVRSSSPWSLISGTSPSRLRTGTSRGHLAKLCMEQSSITRPTRRQDPCKFNSSMQFLGIIYFICQKF